MNDLFSRGINRNLLILLLMLAGLKGFAAGTRFKAPSFPAINAPGPQVTGVSVPLNDYYRAGRNLDFKVRYDQPVIVEQATGIPYINITIGLNVVQAPYTGGTGTSELTFRYTVQDGDMDMDGITVQPLVQNDGGTIKDALGNDASTVLQNVASTTLVRVNTSIPSVTLSTVPMPTNAPFIVTAVFSEPVTGLTVSDFNVLNTTVSSLSTSDNITYKVLMTPSSEATRPIRLPSGVVENIGHNPNLPSNTLMYTYDVTRPVITAVTVPTPRYYKAGETLTFTVTFNEDITLNLAGGSPRLRLSVGSSGADAVYSSAANNSITFSYTVADGDMDMDGITVNALIPDGAGIRDIATNNADLTLHNIDPTVDVRVNTSHPAVTVTSAAPAIANAPFPATITFNEPVSNFIAGDVTVSNGTVTNFTAVDPQTYNIIVSPTTDGTVTVNVAVNVAENIAANGNNASNTLSRIYDITPPSVTSVDVPPNGFYKASSIMDFTVHFSENITLNTTGGNPQLSLTFGSSTVNATFTGMTGADALNFSYTVVNGDMDMDGITVSALLLNGSTIQDIVNNNVIPALNNVGNTTGIFVNTQHPSVALSTAAPALVNAPYMVTITFSEAVTGFTGTDFSITNATVSAPLTANNITYTVMVSPTASPVSISVPAGAAVNIGDNDNTASNTLINTYDATAPAVTAVAVPPNGYYKAGTTLNFIVRFSEDITVNTTSGTPWLGLNIGAAIAKATFTGTNGMNGLNFSYTVQSGDMDMDGITVSGLLLNGATIRDDATNNADLALNNISNTTFVRVNTTIPAVTLSTTETGAVNMPFIATVTFSEPVNDLTMGDFSTVNAGLSGLSTLDNITYTLTVTPLANGPVSISLPADKAVNIGDNGNAASNTLSLIYDIIQPTITSVTVPADKYYIAGQALNFSVNFDEDINLNQPPGADPYLTLTIGTTTVHATYTGASTARTLNFSYNVLNGDNDMDGIAVGSLVLNGADIQDLAGNNAVLTLNNIGNTANVKVNTIKPTVVISSAANALINGPVTVTAVFSEPVTILTESDFSITNATASGLTSPDNITFTLTVTPGVDGPVSVLLPANGVVNVAGNANISSNTLNFTYDGTRPTVNAVNVPVNGYYKAGNTLNFTVRFSENITLNTSGGNPQLELVIGTSTVNAAYTGTSGTDGLNFSYTVVNGDMDMNGIAVSALLLNGAAIYDTAGNNVNPALNNTGNTTNIFVNTQHPTVTLSTTAAAAVRAPYTVTVAFSEAVTGFIAGKVAAVNATVSNLQTADNITYTVLVTPAANGPVSISVPADAAINIGANGNTASNTLSNTYDAVAPLVTSVSVPANGYYNAGTTLNFTVNFGEDILVNTTGGAPTLGINIGAATVNAAYTGTAGTKAINFSYTVQAGDMDMDGINVGALVLNGAAIKDVAGNDAVLTLNNVGNASSVWVNTTHPTVTITTSSASHINTPFVVDIAFSENVTGFTSGDVAVTNGTSSPVTVIDNAHFNITVVPDGNGVVTVTIPANAAQNIGHNDNTASNTLSINYDITQPVVASVTVPADKYYTTGQTLNFSVNFAEDINLNMPPGADPYLTLTIGTSTVNAAYTGTSSARAVNFSYTVVNGDNDLDGITVNSLVLNGSTISDLATNDAIPTLNNIGNTANVKVSTTNPTVVLTSAANALINGPVTVTATFSEPVTILTESDFSITNATASGLTSPDNITFTLTITPGSDGPVSVQVPTNAVVNVGGNTNLASNTLNFTYDGTKPTVNAVTVPANNYYKAGDVLNFTTSFSENIRLNTTGGTPYLNIILSSGLVKAAYTNATANSLLFSYTVQAGDMDLDGIALGATLSLNGSTIKDDANNDADLTLNNAGSTTGVFINTRRPAVTLSASAPALVNAPYTATVAFTETVTGFDISDITVVNATLSNLQTADNITYTVLVTPAANGPVNISVPADKAVNTGGNGNAASNTLTTTYDNITPTVTSVSVPANGYYKTGTTLNFTVQFSENITLNTSSGNPALDLNIGAVTVNATYTGVTGINTLNFSYTVQSGDMDMDGITVSGLLLNGATIRDDAGNNANLALNNIGNTTLVRVNTAIPIVTLSTTVAGPVNMPFVATVTFSEPVTGLTMGDFSTVNAGLSGLSTTDNIIYTLTVIPLANGNASISLPADKAVNIGSNGNAASNTVSINYDIIKPTVASVTVPADKYYTAGQTLNFSVNFTEDINLNIPPGADPYLTLTIGATTVHAAYTGASTARTLNFSYTVVNGDNDMDGITVNSLVLNAATIKDAAGNDAVLTLNNTGNTTGVKVSTTQPSVVISSTANTVINGPVTVTAVFSEPVTVLTESDFSITNATASGLTSPDNITFTLTVTPGVDGPVSIQLPANGVVNTAGNANLASNTLNFTYDGTKPTVNAVTVPANGYYKAGTVLSFAVSFSENIQVNTTGGAPYLDIILNSGTVKAAYTSATANSLLFSYTVQPGDMDPDGIALGTTLHLNGSTIKDGAMNNAILTLNNTGNTSGIFIQTGSPSVQLSAPAATRVNTPFIVSAVFSEAVTGLAAGDFTVTNGVAGNLQTTDNITYTVTITPASDGAVTVQLPAAHAQNAGANGNTASNTITVNYDATAPLIPAGLAFSILERSTVGTLVGKVTATEATGILQNWTITADDSNGAFSIDANGNILVKDQAKLNSKVNTTVTLAVTVGDGLNTSAAVPVTIQVKAVNQAPTLNAIDDVTICSDGQEHTIQLAGASAVEADQTYSFSIFTNKAANFDQLGISATGLITYQLKNSAAGTSSVTVTIRDNGGTANGGTDTLRRSFNIEVATLGAITISSDKGNTISKGDIVQLSAAGGTTYQWDNADGIISGQQSAVLKVRPMQNTTYHVTASNNAGCTNTADFTVTIVSDFKVDAVNLLTPNGDGKNDKWVIRNLDSYPNNEVKIFDRTGRLVYTRRNYSNEWDGTMNGSPLAEGTYYYILTIDGGTKTAKGYITIIRDRN